MLFLRRMATRPDITFGGLREQLLAGRAQHQRGDSPGSPVSHPCWDAPPPPRTPFLPVTLGYPTQTCSRQAPPATQLLSRCGPCSRAALPPAAPTGPHPVPRGLRGKPADGLSLAHTTSVEGIPASRQHSETGRAQHRIQISGFSGNVRPSGTPGPVLLCGSHGGWAASPRSGALHRPPGARPVPRGPSMGPEPAAAHRHHTACPASRSGSSSRGRGRMQRERGLHFRKEGLTRGHGKRGLRRLSTEGLLRMTAVSGAGHE